MKQKRKYTHRKNRIIPIGHGSIVDELDHGTSPNNGHYKTKRKKGF